ncbi:alpha/beta hydrolase [Paraclostridium sordellii]|uniref:alpha/beta hydrolase n=1 Tax=Paraclostridium sordellii TaxID=1505 RepID=UPI0005E3B8FB|nr:alpha/beta hydrolase [Paeniclostridium sordellii]CEO22390.1 alpha/beta hydrolase [[Clostridium] sordellii] [Paeniclostridium sordellii]CEQ14254.1 alpha/beta hydrolase [[Clostridium] sordellii] [Paeniclostridium sordellii]
MIKKYFKIENIPAILWGESSENIFIAVHGNLSNKEDDIIQIFAKKAVSLGYQVISFDLPEHGERVEEDIKCKVWDCVRELNLIMNYVKQNWNNISLFACSMGAYFSLLAYKDDFIKQSLFISPVLNMKRIIDNMMLWFDIDEEYLKSKQIVKTSIGQNLYWDYYCDVKDNPIDKWNITTNILYGLKDDLCESDIVFKFVKRFNCNITVMNKGEHYFHTQEQLKFFKQWVDESIRKII